MPVTHSSDPEAPAPVVSSQALAAAFRSTAAPVVVAPTVLPIPAAPAPGTRTAYLGDHVALTMLEDRLMIFVDTRSNDIAPHLLMHGFWERDCTRLFESLIRPGDTVFDLGAHLGVYTLLAAAATGPTGRVHAFEPNPHYAALAARSITVNGFASFAAIHNLAVGEAEGEADLRFSWAFGGGGHVALTPPPRKLGARPAGIETHRCRIAALDEFFDDPTITVDVMKMDVEGAEGRALRGMWQLIDRSPDPKLIFEFAPTMMATHGVGAVESIHLMAELGLRFWRIGGNSTLTPLSVAEMHAISDGMQYILATRQAPLRA